MKRKLLFYGSITIIIIVLFYPGIMLILGFRKEQIISCSQEVETLRWRNCAERGDSGCMHVLGMILLKKDSTKKEGEVWIKKAAKLGYEDAKKWMEDK